ncbi:MAG: PAS domain S-box protein [Xanthomonadaceae bacterium]|nr:PAS domain S-box protein [Xanthomonadaceae bacterium]
MSFEFAVDPKSIFFRCVEDSGEAIMISDTQGTLVYVNPAWCKAYGYTKEEAIGSSPKLLHSGHQPQEFYQEMWRKILNPSVGTWKGELVNKAKDGTLVPVQLTITPFKDDDQQIAGFMGIAANMSYQKELETKITHQDRLASIGLLASGLAHEVGTPLGVIRGRAEFLMMQTDNPTMTKNLELITSQIDRISKLIRSLLSISRSVSELNIQTLNLHSVAEEIIDLVGQNLKEDSVQITMEIAENIMIKADHARLQQVFLNLIVNSIYAIKKDIEQGKKRPHFLKISALQTGSQVDIRIQDSGCGISPENMKKLFKPFFTTKDVGEGTGLGLAIVAQLMREMGGKISVESKLNEGTTFTLGIISGQSY